MRGERDVGRWVSRRRPFVASADGVMGDPRARSTGGKERGRVSRTNVADWGEGQGRDKIAWCNTRERVISE
jgi:hypothetical protein